MSNKRKMHKCSHCAKIATWLYMPVSHGVYFFCDDCVPRGCTCNVMDLDMEKPDENLSERTIWWSKETYKRCFDNNINPVECCTHIRENDSYHYEILDENGKRFPCCEYDYSPDGYEREYNTYSIAISDIIAIFNKVIETHKAGSLSMVEGIKKLISNECNNEVLYNQFMTKVAKFCRPYINCGIFKRNKLNQAFYNSFRSQCYEKRCNVFSPSIEK